MPALTWTLVVATALVASMSLRTWLVARQCRHVTQHRDDVPAAFRASLSAAAHRNSADYTVAKARLGNLQALAGAVVLLGWTFFGGLDALNSAVDASIPAAWGGVAHGVALIAAFGAIGTLVELPFELYATFVLEARFGFNRMTWRLWLADALKGLLLAALIGLPLLAVVLWLMAAGGSLWWFYAWAVWVGFSLLMLVLGPTVIAPLFNRFDPLADAGLAERIEALMSRTGFAVEGLFVMDGSRRSAHANAYFTGFGRAKRVVFFDTLLARLVPAEVEAVLAHELGHYARRHLVRRIVWLLAGGLAVFAVLGALAQQGWFYRGLGVTPSLTTSNDGLALILFALVAPLFAAFVSPLFAQLSRKHEFEADAYACEHADGRALAAALLKLHEDNASTVTPDPLFARFYYSHPPAAERLAALVPTA